MDQDISKAQALQALLPTLSFSGYKTYIVCAAMVGYGSFLVYTGHQDQGTRFILEGLGLAGLRQGVSKSGPGQILGQVVSLVNTAIQLQPPDKEPPASG